MIYLCGKVAMGMNTAHFAFGWKKCRQQLEPLLFEYIGYEGESLPLFMPYLPFICTL